MTRLRNIFSKEISYYLMAVLLCLIFLFLVMHLWAADLKIPFVYGGDGVWTGASVKGIIENGWNLHNPSIGMPQGYYAYDFYTNDNLNMAIMKMISFVFPNWALTLNIYFLLTFPLTVITTLFALRKMKVSPLPAMAGSLLFAFISFHFIRGEVHLVLSAYFLIPLVVLVIFWIFEDDFLLCNFKKGSPKPLSALLNRKNIFSIIVCILIGTSFFYYPFFSCFFLLVAGVLAAISRKRWIPLLNSLLLIGVIVLCVIAYSIPTLLYTYQNGRNWDFSVLTTRYPQDSEIGGLKIIQLLLPIRGHRIPLFDAIANKYAQSAPLVSDNISASLGIIGSIGFIILIFWLFYRLLNKDPANKNETLTKISQISTLNLAAVLLATIGGFGTVFAYLIFPYIRAYNRISVFIAFFSITAIMLLIDLLIKKYSFSKVKKGIIFGCIVFILFFGLFDQTSGAFIPDYKNLKVEFLNDERFISSIEEKYPDDNLIFQLPYMPFPENGSLNRMLDYDHFRAYLHSKNIRWSYGTMRGREGDLWQRFLTSQPANEMIQELSFAGFNGIYVDGYGYADGGKETIASISSILDETPLVSDNGRFCFFDMTPYNINLDTRFTPKELEEQKSKTLDLMGLMQRSFDLPPETADVQYAIDTIAQTKLYGKSSIDVSGWAFIDGENPGDNQINIVLKSEENQYIFGTISVDRTDVAAAFSNQNLLHVGFTARFPVEQIQDGKYKVGICISKGDLLKLRYTNVMVAKSGDTISRLEEQGGLVASEQLFFNLPPETSDVQYSIDTANKVESNDKTFIEVAGWAFINGENPEGSQINVVLKSENNQYIFDTILNDRPDVAAALNNQNLVHVGFVSRIPAELIKDGEYKIGTCVTKGDLVKLRYTNVAISKYKDAIQRTE